MGGLFEDVWPWNGTDFKIIEKCLSKMVGEFIKITISNRKQKLLPQERVIAVPGCSGHKLF